MAKTKLFDFTKNFKKGFAKDELLQDLTGLIAVPLYTIIPSALRMTGFSGWAVATLVPYFIGKALGVYSISKAALAIGGVHLMYVYGDGILNAVSGDQGAWRLGEPKVYSPTATTSELNGVRGLKGLKGLNGMRDYVVTRKTNRVSGLSGGETPNTTTGYQKDAQTIDINGSKVIYYPALPTANKSLNDYVGRRSTQVNDYVSTKKSAPTNRGMMLSGLISPVIANNANY